MCPAGRGSVSLVPCCGKRFHHGGSARDRGFDRSFVLTSGPLLGFHQSPSTSSSTRVILSRGGPQFSFGGLLYGTCEFQRKILVLCTIHKHRLGWRDRFSAGIHQLRECERTRDRPYGRGD